jgi:hypothetical protein
MNDLFDRMSTRELEAYAQTGALPEWSKAMAGASEQSPPIHWFEQADRE